MESTLTLRQAGPGDLEYVRTLLERNDLPTADVESKLGSLYRCYDGDDPIGVGGVEVHGEVGLLRSVVVERSVRGEGVGTALCEALEERAVGDGVETLYLLTTTAADFFADRGYVEIERTDAPPAIRGTTEFEELCPDAARCLRKSL